MVTALRMIIRLTPWAYPVIFQWLRVNWTGFDNEIQHQWLAKFQDNQLYWIELEYDTERDIDWIKITFKEKEHVPEESLFVHIEGITEKLNDLQNLDDFFDL